MIETYMNLMFVLLLMMSVKTASLFYGTSQPAELKSLYDVGTDCKLHNAGQLLPSAEAADTPPVPQAPRGYGAQEPAAQPPSQIRPLGI